MLSYSFLPLLKVYSGYGQKAGRERERERDGERHAANIAGI
jgi:hypothetical protein